jgi:hypothetical protein
MVRPGWLAWASTAIVATLALLALLGSVDWLTYGQPLFDSVLTIPPGGEVREVVEVPEAGLARVDVALVRRGAVNGVVSLRLTADPDGRHVLASVEVPAADAENVDNPFRRPLTYQPFRFSAVSGMASGQAWLWLQSGADRPIYARALQGAPPGAGVQLSGVPLAQRLSLRLHYERSIVDNLRILADRLTPGRSGVIGSPIIYIMLTAMHVALVALILRLIH